MTTIQEKPFAKDFYITTPYPAVIESALFKDTPADFIVHEDLGVELTGAGEHLCVFVEKHNANTNQVASALAKWADIPVKDVSFSGLKDKFAITQQWFSLRIPHQKLPTEPFEFNSDHSQVQILKQQWHQKKLARGTHNANKFTITLKKVIGCETEITQRLEHIKSEGIPNYFMAQRFGKEGNNLEKALKLFNRTRKFKREERSIILSSSRSYLFNAILSQRVQQKTWNKAVLGDVFNFNTSGSIFTAETIDNDIVNRIDTKEIHPTGALWGKGALRTTADIAALENSVADTYPEFATGLVAMDVSHARRPLRLLVQDLTWTFDTTNETLILRFALPSGSYATAVLTCLIKDFYG